MKIRMHRNKGLQGVIDSGFWRRSIGIWSQVSSVLDAWPVIQSLLELRHLITKHVLEAIFYQIPVMNIRRPSREMLCEQEGIETLIRHLVLNSTNIKDISVLSRNIMPTRGVIAIGDFRCRLGPRLVVSQSWHRYLANELILDFTGSFYTEVRPQLGIHLRTKIFLEDIRLS